jgi:hypothetical protein
MKAVKIIAFAIDGKALVTGGFMASYAIAVKVVTDPEGFVQSQCRKYRLDPDFFYGAYYLLFHFTSRSFLISIYSVRTERCFCGATVRLLNISEIYSENYIPLAGPDFAGKKRLLFMTTHPISGRCL